MARLNRATTCDLQNKIISCFNRAALTYDQYCYPQQYIGKQLIQSLLTYKHEVQSIIDIGCGTGLITQDLAENLNVKNFYAIDLADRLLDLAKERLTNYNITIKQQSFANFNFNCKFDAVFANMALQWSTDLLQCLINIKSNLIKNGLLAFTLPLQNTFHELNSKNNFLSQSEVESYLQNTGFTLELSVLAPFIQTFNTWLDCIKSIKATGANCLIHKGQSFLKGIRSKTKPIYLTYQIGYFIARSS